MTGLTTSGSFSGRRRILIGAFASAIALGPILLALNQAATVYVPVAPIVTPAPEERAAS